ncbi:MAG: galactose mutarotase [Candidatus Bathyarchaeota archaeon]|nr:MAG: galactose mutarotase [Candidatus Bathyarchaeota archaeon]
MEISRQAYGATRDGDPVHLFTLKNRNKLEVGILDYGGIVTSLRVPDREGRFDDVVLGYDTLEEYLGDKSYFGCIVGRFVNRIADGRFSLEGVDYNLPLNDGSNHLHGGPGGFNKVLWGADELRGDGFVGIELSHLSRDGEEGYPGNLRATVVYTLTESNELRIEYTAKTDRDTVVNLSHHSYFNLAGGGNILDHFLTLNADKFTPIGEGLIPTGDIMGVEGTTLDFREPTYIGERIDHDCEQLKIAGGYDHNWVLNGRRGSVDLAARVLEPESGRVMEVHTTEPGVQFYSGNFLTEGVKGKGGRVYGPRHGLCLEAQHFPDSPNHPGFPSTVLRRGETYRQTTVYSFHVV